MPDQPAPARPDDVDLTLRIRAYLDGRSAQPAADLLAEALNTITGPRGDQPAAAEVKPPKRVPWTMPEQLAAQVATLATDLGQYAADEREEFDQMSERWRDGDRGTAVDGWLEELGNLADELEALDHEAPTD